MSDKDNSAQKAAPPAGETQNKPKICGIVRPISAMGDGYKESHWDEVHDIISAAVQEAGFEAKLVSDANEIGVIQKRIVQNLYECPLVICDVSGKNPNVMFELGMRLAFDKPTIIIKDELTDYSFDISVIEHLAYPSSLHYQSVLKFASELKTKIKATYKMALSHADYSPFLKSFGELVPAKLGKTEVSGKEYLQSQMDSLSLKMDFLISRMKRQTELSEFIEHSGMMTFKPRSVVSRKSGKGAIMLKLQELQEKRRFVSSARQLAELDGEIETVERQLAALDGE